MCETKSSGNKSIAIPLLHYCMEVKSYMALYCFCFFKANASRFLEVAFVSSFDLHCVCQLEGISGLRRVVDDLQQTKPRRPLTKFTPEQKRLELEASSHSWYCCNSEHIECMRPPKVGVVNGNPQSMKFISTKILSFENSALYGVDTW